MTTKYSGSNSITKLVQLIKSALAGKSDTSHTHPNATSTTDGFMSRLHVQRLNQLDTYRAVCSSVTSEGGSCICGISAYKSILGVGANIILLVQFRSAWQTASPVVLDMGQSVQYTVCTFGSDGSWTPTSASNPLKWQAGAVMLFLLDSEGFSNAKALLLSRNLPIDAADIQTGTLDAARIPALSYLSLSGGTLTGTLEGTDAEFSGNVKMGGHVQDLSGHRLYMPAMAVGKSGSNLNDQTDGEVWWGNNFTNAPVNGTGYVRVVRQSSAQTAYMFQGNTVAPSVYVRTLVNSVWQPWVRLDNDDSSATSGIFTAASGISTVSQKFYRHGKVAQLVLQIKHTSAWTVGTAYNVGTVNSGYRPVDMAAGTVGTHGIANLNADGSVYVRTLASVEIAANSSSYVKFTYILA